MNDSPSLAAQQLTGQTFYFSARLLLEVYCYLKSTARRLNWSSISLQTHSSVSMSAKRDLFEHGIVVQKSSEHKPHDPGR